MFDAIDPNPLGSASLAQVHRARLVTGEDVAVKVQRPGAQQVMAQDIDIIRSVVRIVSKFVNTDQFVDLHGVVEELWTSSLSSKFNEDRYRSGATFSDLYSLFTFDRELRSLTFKFLILAEAKIKTAIAYTFSNVHRGPNDYYLQSSFCTQDEYSATGKDEARYAREISNLTSILSRRALKSKSEFVAHYRNEYGSVPLWLK